MEVVLSIRPSGGFFLTLLLLKNWHDACFNLYMRSLLGIEISALEQEKLGTP